MPRQPIGEFAFWSRTGPDEPGDLLASEWMRYPLPDLADPGRAGQAEHLGQSSSVRAPRAHGSGRAPGGHDHEVLALPCDGDRPHRG